MPATELEPFRAAIRQHICTDCVRCQPGGTCDQPREHQCALAIHVGTLVKSILSVKDGAPTSEYRKAMGARMCTICPHDETGFCSLLELVDGRPDNYIENVVRVVRKTADA